MYEVYEVYEVYECYLNESFYLFIKFTLRLHTGCMMQHLTKRFLLKDVYRFGY